MRRPEGLGRLAVLAAMLAAAACAGVLFTAPPGSSVRVLANPPFVPAEGGISTILAILTEPAGTPVSDGTVVLFFSDIGRVEPAQQKTRDGIARVSFVSDSRSGIATITALSGGQAPAATTPTTTMPGGTPGTGGGTTGDGAGTVQVTVGNANVATIGLRADPPRITISNSTHVFAVVLGSNGNPISNVPVYFEVLDDAGEVQGGTGTEFFDITGPVFTNNNGEAENVMRTRRQLAGTARVRARAPGPDGFIVSEPLGIPIL
ncbi:MAG TPA: hypothetical protein VMR21_08380 [Vicinamibacteria bacterium]|nr:hypothetical protein [Vicinamibacteria bacterium]